MGEFIRGSQSFNNLPPTIQKYNIKTKIEEKLRNKTVVSRHFFVLVLTDSIYCLRDINAKFDCWQFMTTLNMIEDSETTGQ